MNIKSQEYRHKRDGVLWAEQGKRQVVHEGKSSIKQSLPTRYLKHHQSIQRYRVSCRKDVDVQQEDKQRVCEK
jgi:hypothetical protein